jgi:hypothetical protein
VIQRLAKAPIHPLAVALFPIVSLVAANLGQVRPTVGVRVGVLSVALALLLFVVLRPLSGSWHKAALLSSCVMLLFFSYGHVYNSLRAIEAIGTSLGRHRYLVPAFGFVAVGLFFLIRRWSTLSASTTAALNLGSIALLTVPLLQIAFTGSPFSGQARGALEVEATDLSPAAAGSLPDVYYIVLDAYTRGDVMRASFDFDNEHFLEQLRSLGFYVANCSMANYAQTELSLAATLNGGYLEALLLDQPLAEWERSDLWPLLRHSQLRHLFEELGYSTVAAETGYYWSEWEDADRYLAPEQGWLAGMNALEGTLLRSTAAWAAIDALPVLPAFLSRDLDRSAESHRERVDYVLDSMKDLAHLPGPKLAFIHIVSPHRPFVFDAEGNPIDDDYTWTQSELGLDSYRLGYRAQVAYLNRRMESILTVLLDESDAQPIILLQGDHGPEEGSDQDRMRILNAFYLAGEGYSELYPSISPVNSFRVILNSLFDAKLPLLPDESYYSIYDTPFDFSVVNDDCAH